MHSTTQLQPQYRIINRAQEVWAYNTLEAAVLALTKAALQQDFFLSEVLADRFSYETRVDIDGVRHTTPAGQLIVRTSLGDVVTRDQVLDLAHKLRARPAAPEGAYRNGPWPGIRWPRGHRGSTFRIVRTKQAMTWHDADKEDLLLVGGRPVASRDCGNFQPIGRTFRGTTSAAGKASASTRGDSRTAQGRSERSGHPLS